MKSETLSLQFTSGICILALGLIAAAALKGSFSHAQQAPFDWTPVGAAVGKAGTVQPDGVYKIGLPRADLHVKIGDVELKPALALGSWIAFRKRAAATMTMGDLVLTEDEVPAVMARLQEGGIE